MSKVFVAEVGQLTNRSKTELRRAGVAVVEVNDLTKCQFVQATSIVTGNGLLWASIAALAHNGGWGKEGTTQRDQFVANLAKIVREAMGQVPETKGRA